MFGRDLTDDLELIISWEELEECWWVGTRADEGDADLEGRLALFEVHGTCGCECCHGGDEGEDGGLHCR